MYYQDYTNVEWRPWQEKALEMLENQQKEEILWIYDKIGNTGKTFLARYIENQMDGCFLHTAHAGNIRRWHRDEEYVVVDHGRPTASKPQYKSIKDLKERGYKVLYLAAFPPNVKKHKEMEWNVHETINNDLVKLTLK